MEKFISLINTILQSKAMKIPKWFLWIVLCIGVIGTPTITSHVAKNNLTKVLIEKDNKTSKLLAYRAEISSKIDSILRDLGYRTNADRTFLGEYSNTVVGASGMHFLYYTINNEYTKVGVSPIGSDHQKQNFSNYKFNSYLADHKVYAVRDIDSIQYADPITYLILSKNKTRSAFMMYFELDGIPIGFVGISYLDGHKITLDDNTIFYEISRAIRKISILFDFKSYVLETSTNKNNE